MNQSDIKKIVENLVQTFLDSGKISLDLRKKGLTKKQKTLPMSLQKKIMKSKKKK